MAKEQSPFRPGHPVPVEFFVGRKDEIEVIVRYLKQVLHGRQENFFILGERGIGKSSLGSLVGALSEREYSFLSVHVQLGGVNTLEDMVKHIFDRLLNISADKPWHQKILGLIGDRVRKIDLFGLTIELDVTPQELKIITNNFTQSLRNLLDSLRDSKKALLIILDDINGLAQSSEFANWYKSFVDEIVTSRNPLPLMMILVGLPERRNTMIQSQPSLSRVFTLVDVRPLSMNETREFYCKAFKSVNVTVEDKALDFLSQVAGGLPMLIHEIGEAVFWIDEDDNIDMVDAGKGVLMAANIVGSKYIDPKVYDAIRSKRYKSILKKMFQEPGVGENFQKREVESRLSKVEKKAFNNFLSRFRELEVFDSDGRGGYRFVNTLYYLYLLISESDFPRSYLNKIK